MSEANYRLKSLSAAQERELGDYAEKWRGWLFNTKQIDMNVVRPILERVYAIEEKPIAERIEVCSTPKGFSEFESEEIKKPEREIFDNRQNIVRKTITSLIPNDVVQKIAQPFKGLIENPRTNGNRRSHCEQYLEWLFLFDFAANCLEIEEAKVMQPYVDLCGHCKKWMLFEKVCALKENAAGIYMDESRRLHREDGPAVHYNAGAEYYFWKGLEIDRKIIMEPFTVKDIDGEQNLEIRRVMIDKYGQGQYLMDSGATERHRDDWGVLYEKQMGRDEALVMVKVVNSTPEPDGTYKDYFIRVPPDMRTAREAIAWTFQKQEGGGQTYSPIKET